jgi:hypothetical protein
MSRWIGLISIVAGAAMVWNMLMGRKRNQNRFMAQFTSMLSNKQIYKLAKPLRKAASRGVKQLIKR